LLFKTPPTHRPAQGVPLRRTPVLPGAARPHAPPPSPPPRPRPRTPKVHPIRFILLNVISFFQVPQKVTLYLYDIQVSFGILFVQFPLDFNSHPNAYRSNIGLCPLFSNGTAGRNILTPFFGPPGPDPPPPGWARPGHPPYLSTELTGRRGGGAWPHPRHRRGGGRRLACGQRSGSPF